MKNKSTNFLMWASIVSMVLMVVWALLVVAGAVKDGDFILYLLEISVLITVYHWVISLIAKELSSNDRGDSLDIDPISGKTIAWGQAAFDMKTLKDSDVRVTNISVDTEWDMVRIVREIGLDVRCINITMEEARRIGFINLDALGRYLEE